MYARGWHTAALSPFTLEVANMEDYMVRPYASKQAGGNCVSWYIYNLALTLALSKIDKNANYIICPTYIEAVTELWNKLSRDDQNLIASYFEDEFEFSTRSATIPNGEKRILAEFFYLKPENGKIPANVKRFIGIIKDFREKLTPKFGENFAAIIFKT